MSAESDSAVCNVYWHLIVMNKLTIDFTKKVYPGVVRVDLMIKNADTEYEEHGLHITYNDYKNSEFIKFGINIKLKFSTYFDKYVKMSSIES